MATIQKYCAPGSIEVSSLSHPDYLIEIEAIAIL
jgi:enamine deaminase RidA (YjgF/YER057c/UK114 family)